MHLTITNRSLLPTGSLMLEDQLPEPDPRQRPLRRSTGLFSRESRTVSYRMPRLPRGRYRAGPLHIRLTDPFHLVDVRRSFTATSEIVVAPVVERLRTAEPPRSLDVGDDAGSHSIGARGADDASTREYRTGDDLRKIHWRSSARTGALMVRQEERPWQGQMTVLLDTRSGAHVDRPGDRRTASGRAVAQQFRMGGQRCRHRRDVRCAEQPRGRPAHRSDAPVRLPMLTSNQVGDHLALVRSNARASLETLSELLARHRARVDADRGARRARLGEPAPARERASARDVDERDGAAARRRAPGPTVRTPDAVDGAAPVVNSRVQNAARVLRAAGWQAHVVRCGDSVGRLQCRRCSRRGPRASGLSELAGYARTR